MAATFLSPNWYRVASLKISLRNHVELHRQTFRGKTWYVIQDAQSGRYFRVSPATRTFVLALDGTQDVETVWLQEGAKLGKEQPSQDQVIELIAQLHRADLIRGDVPPDVLELSERAQRTESGQLWARYKNPLALRFPLWDPDRFLTAVAPLFKPLFSWPGMLLWLSVLCYAGITATLNWEVLTGNLSDRVLSVQNVLLVILIYPVVKALHELGHGIAAKVWGGEVHETGVMLLVFMPVPYVDASSSIAFPGRGQRALVAAAGIAVESMLAAIALFVWLAAEPGLLRAVAFNVMLIGGVSTVLFNGNPLLRFDGYYVFSELVGIPNLGQRASRYLLYLLKRYVYRLPDQDNPAHGAGEARWLLFYGIASFCYRLFITFTIALFVATQFFFIGVLVACYAVFNALVMPLIKGCHYLVAARALDGHRPRVQRISALLALAVLMLLFVVPAPYSTRAEGVLKLDDSARVVSHSAGFITSTPRPSGTTVAAGDALVIMEDQQLVASIALLTAQLREYRASYEAINLFDPVQAKILREQIARTEASLDFFQQRQAGLIVTAQRAGRLLLPQAADLPGRYIEAGEVVGYVLSAELDTVRVVVPQSQVALVRTDTSAVEVRSAAAVDRVFSAQITRAAPSAIEQLPSAILGVEGGGDVAINPQVAGNLQPLSKHFQFDVTLERAADSPLVDGRYYVKFKHSATPLGWQFARSLRQVFLSVLNV
jgi:putative peptide zinc metalloprotease protein